MVLSVGLVVLGLVGLGRRRRQVVARRRQARDARVKGRTAYLLAHQRSRVYRRYDPLRGPWVRLPHEAPDGGQSYADFLSERRPLFASRALLIQPFADAVARPELATLRPALTRWLGAVTGRTVRWLAPLAVPDDARVDDGTLRAGILAAHLGRVLVGHPHGSVVIGLTGDFISQPDKDVLSAMNVRRAAVISLRRKGFETLEQRLLLRTLLDQAGHLVGTRHCAFYVCALNGARTVLEVPTLPLVPCPVCLRKLIKGYGGGPASERIEAMAAVLESLGHADAAGRLRETGRVLTTAPWWHP